MVHHEIEDDVNTSFPGLSRQVVEVGQGAVHGIDIFVVGNVVTEIDLRRGEARRDPDRIYAQIFQVIQL